MPKRWENGERGYALMGLLKRFLDWIDTERAERLARILKPYVEGAVLDVGSWNGHVASRLDHKDIVGIDVAVPAETRIEVRPFDGVHIPFGDKAFDTVLCCGVLHHVDNVSALLDEMGRVGKRLVILEDKYDTMLDKLSVLLLHAVGSRLVHIPYKASGFQSSDCWRRLFAEHGLRVSSCTLYGSFQPCWLFLRANLFVLQSEASS
jgi:SAM-dependent methyltransferase